MTARLFWSIDCDAESCLAQYPAEAGGVMNETATTLRRWARSIGWRVGLPGGRDLCPDHASD